MDYKQEYINQFKTIKDDSFTKKEFKSKLDILNEIKQMGISKYDQDKCNEDNFSFALIYFLLTKLIELAGDKDVQTKNFLLNIERSFAYKAPELKKMLWDDITWLGSSLSQTDKARILLSTCYDYAFN